MARAASLQHFGKSETYFVILLERLEVQAPNVYKGQEFWIRAVFVAGYVAYDANNFTATIELPEGFKLKEGQTYSHKNPAIPAYGYWATEWVVVAPNKTGTYIINVSVDSSFPQKKSVSITVTHKPVNPVIEIRGTEYQSGEVGTIYAQIRDEDGTPINLANCSLIIYYPNNTIWKEDKLNYLYGSLGLYYYTFIVPSIEGVYSISVNCSEPEVYGFSTFHVSKWATQILESYEKIGEIKNIVDSIKEKTDKIPGIRTAVSTISLQLQNLGISISRSFVLSLVILCVFISAGIIVSLYVASHHSKKEEEKEWF